MSWDWDLEEWKAREAGARVIAMPTDEGVWTESVTIGDILDRRVWFGEQGIFKVSRQGKQALYIGSTTKPIRERFIQARVKKLPWAMDETFTVQMEKMPPYPRNTRRVWGLIERNRPMYNSRRGRVRSRMTEEM